MQLADAERLAQLPEHVQAVARLKVLHHYVQQFWDGVDVGMTRLEAGVDLRVRSQIAAVVAVTPRQLVIRVAGQNRRFALDDLPPELLLAVAQLWFERDDAVTKVILGAFLAVDPQGDVNLARRMWLEAQSAGIDVRPLLEFLDRDDRRIDGETDAFPKSESPSRRRGARATRTGSTENALAN
jgi:hypothetical protein